MLFIEFFSLINNSFKRKEALPLLEVKHPLVEEEYLFNSLVMNRHKYHLLHHFDTYISSKLPLFESQF